MATVTTSHATSMQKELEQYKQSINNALEQFFADVPNVLSLDLSEQSIDTLKKIEAYSLRPGKRIRGALACFAYDYVTGQKLGKTGIQAAVALELVQNYLLIVDDVMDRSVLRRGEPTIHELYLAEQKQVPKDTHLSNMLAVNAGLITQHLVNIALMQVDEAASRVQQATLLMHKNIVATGFGQIDDACQQVGKPFSEEDILRKYTLKSGYYTFVNPLQLGLVLGGHNDPKTLREITDFGLTAGLAFQLKDDLLGIFASSDTTGKPNTDDIEEGKYTLLIQYALQNATEDEQKVLKDILGKPGTTDAQVKTVQEILENSGAKQHVEGAIAAYADEAKAYVTASTFWNEAAREVLTGIVDYSVQRQR